MAKECACVANSLSIAKVVELFENLPDYNFVIEAPVNAKGGEVYIYKPACPEKEGMMKI